MKVCAASVHRIRDDDRARAGRLAGIGLACGAINGALVVGLGGTRSSSLGTMWIVRDRFVSSNAESILLPRALTNVAEASLGLRDALYPVPCS
jgi:hypothetical protein